MAEANDDIARRVLASVLERLGDGAGSPSQRSAMSEQDSRSSSSGDPVVVVVLGQGSRNETPIAHVTNQPLQKTVSASHPGLEKFELPKASLDTSAPKTCFMEPDRPCINSGACQTRGY